MYSNYEQDIRGWERLVMVGVGEAVVAFSHSFFHSLVFFYSLSLSLSLSFFVCCIAPYIGETTIVIFFWTAE